MLSLTVKTFGPTVIGCDLCTAKTCLLISPIHGLFHCCVFVKVIFLMQLNTKANTRLMHYHTIFLLLVSKSIFKDVLKYAESFYVMHFFLL